MPFDTRLDKEDLWTLTKLLTALPGVKPRVAVAQLVDSHLTALAEERDSFELGGSVTPVSMGSELFEENYRGLKVVTPTGASWLVNLYSGGYLPMKRKTPQKIPAEVLAYLVSQEELAEKAAQTIERKRVYQNKVANPETVLEEEFSYGLLNDIFIEHKGLGWRGSMEIGGVSVHKDFQRFVSNTAKSQDFAVTYSWHSSDGELRTLHKPSRYEGNRRNDPDRNHGLYD